MPFYLDGVDVVPELAGCRSALIVVCRFCPAASMAMRKDRPYLELFHGFPDTGAYEEYIDDMRTGLEREGLEVGVFRGGLVNFIICAWTEGQRGRLLEKARRYEAVVVLGCDAALDGVRGILETTGCRVVHGMESEGVFDAIPRFRRPGEIRLDLVAVTPMTRAE